MNLCIIHKFFPDQSAQKEEEKEGKKEVMVCDEAAWLLRFLS